MEDVPRFAGGGEESGWSVGPPPPLIASLCSSSISFFASATISSSASAVAASYAYLRRCMHARETISGSACIGMRARQIISGSARIGAYAHMHAGGDACELGERAYQHAKRPMTAAAPKWSIEARKAGMCEMARPRPAAMNVWIARAANEARKATHLE